MYSAKLFSIITGMTIVLAVLSSSQSIAQTSWARTYGGINDEKASAIQQTSDGGYVVAGYTESYGAGDADLWMLKLDTDGAAQWEGTYGGSDNDVANSIQLTGDGGYIVAGYTGAYPYYDAWVLKLDANGTVQWEKAYSGSNVDKILNIQTTSDGGYIAFGYTSSYGAGSFDHLLLKLDASGTVQWEKTYGTSDPDMGYSIKQTSDGGFFMAGVISTATNGLDFMMYKVDPGGSSQWEKKYGGSERDIASSIQQTADGGFVMAGTTDTYGVGADDVWLLKLDANGAVQWEKTYGGSGNDQANAIQLTSDGGFVMAGTTDTYGVGADDVWLLKLDASGAVQWEKTYGGINDEKASAIQQTSDGGYVVAGYTESYGAGDADLWMLKLDSGGEIADCAMIKNSTATVVGSSTTVTDLSENFGAITTSLINTSSVVAPTDAAINTVCGEMLPEDIAVPTLTEWGLIIFITVMMGIGMVILRKRRMI